MSAARTFWFQRYIDDYKEKDAILEDAELVTNEWKANLVGSELTNGLHSPALDLDVEHTWIPSSTQGHGHLLIDGVQLPWWKYRALLRVLAWCGILDKAYVEHSIRRGGTFVRKGVYKGYDSYQANVNQLLSAASRLEGVARRVRLTAQPQRKPNVRVDLFDDVEDAFVEDPF